MSVCVDILEVVVTDVCVSVVIVVGEVSDTEVLVVAVTDVSVFVLVFVLVCVLVIVD